MAWLNPAGLIGVGPVIGLSGEQLSLDCQNFLETQEVLFTIYTFPPWPWCRRHQ